MSFDFLARLGLEVDSRQVRDADRANDDFTVSAGRADRAADRMGQSTERMGRRVGGASRRVASAAGAIAGMVAAAVSIGAAVTTISTFEGSMSQVEAITRATESEMQVMRDTARDLGSTTEFSASQAADGLRFLGMAGFEASESVAAIPAVLDLATAASMGLSQAADITSNIMSAFNVDAANASSVTDILAAASSRANTDVAQLGSAMSTVGPIAAALGIDLADTAAAIGVMSDAGIQGQRAGTAMRGVLASLAGPTTQAQDVLRSLGLTIEDVNPEANDLATIMDRLAGSGISTADAMTIFGREASSGALVLVEGAGRLREFGDELSNVDGEARRMADVIRDQLGGDINSLKSAVEGLILALGDAGLTAVLRFLIGLITDVTRFVTSAVDAVGRLTNAVGEMLSFATAQDRIAESSAQAAVAISHEVQQAVLLAGEVIGVRTMSVDVAGVKLLQARAHLEAAAAIREENLAAIRGSEVFQRQLEQQAFFNEEIQEYYRNRDRFGADQEGAHDAADFAYYVQSLQSAVRIQEELLASAGELSPEYIAAEARVDLLERAIENAVDGMVTFGGATEDTNSIALQLSDVLAGMRLDSALVDFVEALSTELEIGEGEARSLAAAMGLSEDVSFSGSVEQVQALSRALGIATRDAIELAQNLPGYSDGGVSGPDQAIAQTREELTPGGLRRDDIVLRRVFRSSGGAVGGGGGITEAQREHNELLSEAERIVEGLRTPMEVYNDNLAQAERLLDAGVLSLDDYTSHVDQLREELSREQISPFLKEINSISDALARAIVQGEDLGDAMRGVFQRMAQDLISSGIQSLLIETFNFGGSRGGGLFGSLLGGLFGGFRADGGPVSAATAYMVGERGPELFVPQSSGQIIPNHAIDGMTRSLHVSVSIDGEGSIRAFVRDEAGRVVAESAPAIVREGANQGQRQTMRRLSQTRMDVAL